MVRKTPFESIKFAILSAAHFKFTHLTFWTTRGENRKKGDINTFTIDKIRPILIWYLFKQVCRSPIGNFRQNFSRQIFFPLAMATKMVAAWSAGLCYVNKLTPT